MLQVKAEIQKVANSFVEEEGEKEEEEQAGIGLEAAWEHLADEIAKVSGAQLADPEPSMSDEGECATPPGLSSGSPIDFVYCWGGDEFQHKASETGGRVSWTEEKFQGGGFGEMRWSLRSVEKHAAWVNKIYLLVNGPPKWPSWLTTQAKEKIEVVDRCKLFDKADDCPTSNTAACQSVMHRVPGLSEHFVYMEDDWILPRCTAPSDFFTAEGKPLILAEGAETQMPIYATHPREPWEAPPVPGTDELPHPMPIRMFMLRHLPIPLLSSFASSMEHRFPAWFAFVRSHKKRYVCCNASAPNPGNALDEDFNRVYPGMLYNTSVGVDRPVPDGFCGMSLFNVPWYPASETGLSCLQRRLNNQKFVDVNDVDRPKVWRAATHLMKPHLTGPPSGMLADGALDY